MDSADCTDWIKQRAAEIGFSSVGIAPAVTATGTTHLDQWLEAGYGGTMQWLANRRDAYDHPQSVLDGVRSLVMLTIDYRTSAPATIPAGSGRVSRYAWGVEDYHDVIHGWLKQLARDVTRQFPETRVRGVIDTAPLLEREFAQLAGLGWIGKHTLLLNRSQGSWFFLAALLTDLQLNYDETPIKDYCGTCTACLDVCPTDAFPQPHVLDASRCISYLTIEHRDAIPLELRDGMGEWLFGCDLCQEVCPWNNRSPQASEPRFAPRDDTNPVELAELFELDDEAFRARFRRTPLWRPKRRGILRNAAIVLGNHPSESALPALVRGLNDAEPLVRGAAAWALGKYDTAGREALRDRLAVESDPEVQGEIQRALGSPDLGPAVG
ncbi:tRNA epoxyqueuosine(34) reductase QueG [Aeoliella sp. ICT_H6.2]|uniref:tRNA epoxyqueuosine(34) reductase QueG n=1 Tax=Aeoliella straminimaris TaxID=2954799 RepID=A0A9X2FFH8_9BACT|nr:tRNA epoxyqueuosine(34) reductase QueG [Aeoliella straminimaris]MCO6047298.1 tRNA epoxyqueuosine(34) reductase QueG [Aeoliella straminimaris]